LLGIHPEDALSHGLADGGLARITTAGGNAVFRVSASTEQRRGDIFVPMHWTDAMASQAGANRLPGQACDPISGQPGFKNTPARVEPVFPEWRGFLVTQAIPDLTGILWWSRSRIAGGWLYELADYEAVDIDALLPEPHPGVDRLEMADLATGTQRIALRGADGTLIAALYVARAGPLPKRDWMAGQLGGCAASPMELLAARSATPEPDRGALVCLCHGVGERAIEAAVQAGAASVAAVGEVCRAGTNCGSCRPAIARLIEAALKSSVEMVS
jgi:assimilatory nitrate reductase catalytic subunit